MAHNINFRKCDSERVCFTGAAKLFLTACKLSYICQKNLTRGLRKINSQRSKCLFFVKDQHIISIYPHLLIVTLVHQDVGQVRKF